MIVDHAVHREGQGVPGEYPPEAAFKASRCDDSCAWNGLHEHRPALRSPVGHAAVLLGRLVVCTGMCVFFRKRDGL